MSDAAPLPARHVFVASDATGTTCQTVVQSALSQFRGKNVVLDRVSFVRSEEQIVDLVQRAREVNGVVVYTFVSADLRRQMLESAFAAGVATVDILGPILTRFADLLEIAPLSQPGLFRQLDEEYFKRIEAVDYTVKHDDGMGIETLEQAEIVLVGVSRCSKTPVSLYLSFRGFKVANVPIVPDLEPPRQLFEIDARRIVGFTIDPPFLQLIRQERERHLGAGPLGSYTEETEIRREVTHARRLFHRLEWPVINVTAKAIEETASEVMRVVYTRTGLRKGSITAD